MSVKIEKNQAGEPVFVFTSPSSKKPVKVEIDLKPRTGIGSKNDLLYKALGREKNSGKKVLDLTAGLLRDSLHMAKLGYEVTALEREDILYKALSDFLEIHPVDKLQIVNANALNYLNELEELPDLIYLDPMFPDSGESALSAKEAQLLQLIAGEGDEGETEKLLVLAITKAKDRVVLKRPRKSEVLRQPFTYQVIGKSTRYDVYKGCLE